MWSFGAGIQDENENVIINSDATIAAIEYMNELFAGAMTPEVFAWNAASNNQGINAGELSYILNSISAYRTAQDEGLGRGRRHLVHPRPRGPGGGTGRVPCDVQLDRPRRSRT